MKLLFDQNLSHRLVFEFQSAFPESAQVRELGLERADDNAIWEFAREQGFTIISKDADFHQRSFVHGHPPKVIWLRVGNASTQQVLEALRVHVDDIQKFIAEGEASFLILS